MSIPHTPSQTEQASLQAQVDAITLLLQQMVLVLECEPRFTADRLSRWVDTCTRRTQATSSANPATLQALAALCSQVLA
ncbi:hypothetical protein P245_15595 [Comamonas thiooxydans]|uniref:Uncharacterized protein n=1 Tax=Comamonas thiooxydans TaxID=363952 RepID=A0A0E3BD70_9BURK|nr:hypothetical protein [Comamonas thiooxydans]KGG90857.1 hypothetical protein P245_15595 [Comamonas thiooxydans]